MNGSTNGGGNPNEGCISAAVMLLFMLAALSAGAFLLSCSSHRSMEVSEVRNDSTRVDVRREVIYVPDTVIIEIPEVGAERSTVDSVSHLENEYAVSDARIEADGTLYHSLRTKPHSVPVGVMKPIERNDSIVYVERERSSKAAETIEVEVERKRSWIENTAFYGFFVLLTLFAFIIRKRVASFVKMIFK